MTEGDLLEIVEGLDRRVLAGTLTRPAAHERSKESDIGMEAGHALRLRSARWCRGRPEDELPELAEDVLWSRLGGHGGIGLLPRLALIGRERRVGGLDVHDLRFLGQIVVDEVAPVDALPIAGAIADRTGRTVDTRLDVLADGICPVRVDGGLRPRWRRLICISDPGGRDAASENHRRSGYSRRPHGHQSRR